LIVSVTLARRGGVKPIRVFLLGVTTGVVYFAGTLYWIGGVMAQHGGIPSIGAYALMLGLSLQLALFVGLFAWLLSRAVGRFGLTGVWLAPWLWVASEWLRAWLGWNFPWVLLGSAQASVVPVAQLASVTGVYGLSALTALVSTAGAVLAISQRPQDRRSVLFVGLLVLAVIGGGAYRVSRGSLTTSGTPMRVGLLQGNVPQDAKWNPIFRDAILDRYVGLSRQALATGAQLVIWPEASTPFPFERDEQASAPIRRLAAQTHVPFVIGTDEVEPRTADHPEQLYNTAVIVGSDGRSRDTYRKVRLVPFGEYVPYRRLLFFVGPLVESVGDFLPGNEFKVFDVEGTRFSVAICYEAVYASIAEEFVNRGSELLTTITNDAWFERSSAAYQHFDQAALRAVEQGRYLVRAANTGISGAVDPYGRVIARTPLFEATTITVDVRLLSDRTIYNRIGDVVAWLSLAVAALVVWMTRRMRTA
jgi:apolipoprotein N-acyltransferase